MKLPDRERLRSWWFNLQETLWLTPAILTIFSAALALSLVELDQAIWEENQLGSVPLMFDSGAEGAQGVLSAIAGSIMTVTATVFSITIVALQLASSQFTPRLLRTFTGDRVVQIVLGVFIGTFTYSILVLRSIQIETDDRDEFVPYIASTVAIVYALASVAVLIYFIHHISRSIQVAVIVDRAVADELQLIEKQYGHEGDSETPEPVAWVRPEGLSFPVSIGDQSGYLQALDHEELIKCAERNDLTIEVLRRVGDYLLPRSTMALVWPVSEANDKVKALIRDSATLGPERTMQEDVSLGVRQVVDVALRALSPSTNDPTTAIICIDRICQILAVMASANEPTRILRGDERGRVILTEPPTFPDIVTNSFTQVRLYGAKDPIVAKHFIEALQELSEVVPEHVRALLAKQARLMVDQAREAISMPDDLRPVEEAAIWTQRYGIHDV
jgi:uncharacterized membrane protein